MIELAHSFHLTAFSLVIRTKSTEALLAFHTGNMTPLPPSCFLHFTGIVCVKLCWLLALHTGIFRVVLLCSFLSRSSLFTSCVRETVFASSRESASSFNLITLSVVIGTGSVRVCSHIKLGFSESFHFNVSYFLLSSCVFNRISKLLSPHHSLRHHWNWVCEGVFAF